LVRKGLRGLLYLLLVLHLLVLLMLHLLVLLMLLRMWWWLLVLLLLVLLLLVLLLLLLLLLLLPFVAMAARDALLGSWPRASWSSLARHLPIPMGAKNPNGTLGPNAGSSCGSKRGMPLSNTAASKPTHSLVEVSTRELSCPAATSSPPAAAKR
jgi:hypothetical protein